MAIVTDWQPIATDAVWEDEDGNRRYTWDMTHYDDDRVPIDLSPALAVGETASNLVSKLWQLKSVTESADLDVSGTLLLDAAGLEGTIVTQRVIGLTVERVYRLFITFGPSGNKRTRTAVIRCVG